MQPPSLASTLKSRRVLIAGGAGFIGRALTNQLKISGAEVSWLVREQKEPEADVAQYSWDADSQKKWRSYRFTDLVLAVDVSDRKKRSDPETLVQAHVETIFQLGLWAAESKIERVVYLSSGSVYQLGKKPDLYSASKSAAEILLKNINAEFQLQIVRLFRPYGPGKSMSALNRILQMVKEKQVLSLTSPDGPMIQPIYLKDACAAIVHLLTLTGSHTIDLAGKERVTLGDFARRWGTWLSVPVETQKLSEEALDDPAISSSGLAACDDCIRTTLAEGLQILRSSGNPTA